MSNNATSKSQADRWSKLGRLIGKELPHLYGFLADEDGFVELRIKSMPDGTTLSIARGYGEDGGPIVCFGAGYGAVGSLMAIDSTINGGRWRFDKPWKDKSD